MNIIKNILVTAATVLLLQLIPTYPILFGVVFYIAFNWAMVYLSTEADPKTNFRKELSDAVKEGKVLCFTAFSFLGALLVFCEIFDNFRDGDNKELKNMWKYLFKTEPPTIKFQSPIVIKKGVDSESDVG